MKQPLQRSPDLIRIATVLRQIPVHVLDGRLDDVQRITELIELGTRHHELVLAETELSGSTSVLVFDLATRLAAELARPTRTRRLLDRPTAPPTPLRSVRSAGATVRRHIMKSTK